MNIKKVLYDEDEGIFGRMRDGDYSLSEEEKQAIIDFSKGINSELKNGQVSTNEVAIALDIVHTMAGYQEEEWPEALASEAYGLMLKGIKYIN